MIASKSRRLVKSARYALEGLLSVRRLGSVRSAPTEIVTYDGHFVLEPPDAFSEGAVVLQPHHSNAMHLVDHLYEQLGVPDEDDLLPHASFYGRITVEVFPDPDLQWLP